MTEAGVKVKFGDADWSASSYLDPGRVPQRVREMLVVDFDYHVHDAPQAIAPHCEMPWRKSIEAIGAGPFEYLTIPGWSPSQYPWQYVPDLKERRQVVLTPEQARTDRVDLGMDYAVLFPDNLLSQGGLRNADYAVAVARAYNRWPADEWLDGEDGLRGAIMAPPQDPEVAADEIRRYAGNEGFVAVFLPTAFVEPMWGHRRYDPIYDAAQEAGLPVCFHVVDFTVHPVFPYNLHQFSSAFGSGALGHGIALMATLISMMETGVFVRFPRLRAMFAEGGISWLPFISLKMDRAWSEMRQHAPILKELPSTYVKEAVYVATQPIEEPARMSEMATFVEQIGADRIVFASDWPHHDFDHPAKILQIPVGDEAQRRIMGLNAAELLGLEVMAP